MADFDLFTIGAGSGGVAASRRAAILGAKVAIAENRRVGGTCVLRGCVPKKLLIYGVHFHEEVEDAAGYGWTVEGAKLDWPKLIAAKNRELDRLNGIYLGMLRDAGVTLLEGTARLVAPDTVEIDGKTITAKQVLIATGGRPELPTIPGIEHAITSDEALDLPHLPRRITIVGGGYIAVEFAGIFNAAGVEVTLILRGPAILRGFDDDIREHLSAEMAAKGIRILTGTVIEAITHGAQGYALRMKDGATIDTDLVMYATGRQPNSNGLGLEEIGVKLGPGGAIQVDDWQRTSAPNVYAVGDCTDRLNLTPVAIAEGRALVETLFGNNPTQMDHATVATAIFSQPPVGTVGLSESAAAALGLGLDIYLARFRPMKHTLSGRNSRMMLKLVVSQSDGRILGCHMVGADAPEIIQAMAVAVKAGLTKRQLDQTIAIHPTTAEEFVLMREPARRVAAGTPGRS